MNKTIKETNLPVRLSSAEIKNLKESVSVLDPHAVIYLFGSRTDMTKRGGDIDMLIVSKTIGRKDISKIRWNFFEAFGEQKMDIIKDDGSIQTPFVKMVFPKAVQI